MEVTTIIINDAPYGTEKPWNALRLAQALVTIKQKVNIFLTGDAVTVAKKGQNPPEGFYNLEKMLEKLVESDVEVRICATCFKARGMKEDEIIRGVIVGKTLDLARWIADGSKVISY